MISELLDRNIFIKNLLTAKSKDLKSLFVNAKHSRPYINIGIHFDLINSKMTSSDAFLLSERKNDFLHNQCLMTYIRLFHGLFFICLIAGKVVNVRNRLPLYKLTLIR